MPLLAPDDLTVIEVTGADRIDHLDAVTTQRLADARPGEVRGAMVLDVHGAPLATFWVVVHAERLALLAPPASADHVLEVMARRTFLADVRFEATDAPVWALRGEGITAALDAVGLTGLAPGHWRPVGDGLAVRHDFGAEIVGEDLVERLAALDDVATGDDEALAGARILAGEPVQGREVAAPRLPEELGLLPTHVHLAKGCYPGQEAVARMWMLGRPRRRLARVTVEGERRPGLDRRVRPAARSRSPRSPTATPWRSCRPTPPWGTATRTTTGRPSPSRPSSVATACRPGHDPAVPRRRDTRA